MLTGNKQSAASPKSAKDGPENNYADIREGMRKALKPYDDEYYRRVTLPSSARLSVNRQFVNHQFKGERS